MGTTTNAPNSANKMICHQEKPVLDRRVNKELWLVCPIMPIFQSSSQNMTAINIIKRGQQILQAFLFALTPAIRWVSI